MFFEYVEFPAGSVCRVCSKYLRGCYLTNIVDERCHGHPLKLSLSQAHDFGDFRTELSYPPLVSGSVRVSDLTNIGHGLNYLFNGPLQPLQALLDLLLGLFPFGNVLQMPS